MWSTNIVAERADGGRGLAARLPGVGRPGSRVKRVVDIGLATVGLVVAAPVLLLSAVAIVLDSPGGPLFGQERSGRGGTTFRLWKLRTMVADAASLGPQLTQVNDWRVTRVGRILRRTSLDELPQLVNVLAGDMTLVGPRPELTAITATYSPQQREVLAYTPGLTGISQISGRAALPIADKLAMDIAYCRRATLWSDLRIIALTPTAVVSNDGNVM
ncbi:MAG TPA: sugar transferase [Chloroflexota bacterium]|jgi:lipopolysaccharide/colanic/teichoic acid biosynthesis glycosyltransferase